MRLASGSFDGASCPRLTKKARLRWDPVRQAHFLLSPERGLKLNALGAQIVLLCDGVTSVDAIVGAIANAAVGAEYGTVARDVESFLGELAHRMLVEVP